MNTEILTAEMAEALLRDEAASRHADIRGALLDIASGRAVVVDAAIEADQKMGKLG